LGGMTLFMAAAAILTTSILIKLLIYSISFNALGITLTAQQTVCHMRLFDIFILNV